TKASTVLFCVVQTNSGDMLPGIRNTICLMQHGTCRLFCSSGEKKAEICSNLWNRCCISNAEEGRKYKPARGGRAET
uniref:Beta-defensin n=1 Tax=Rhinolophus ferrumequinum TaxID=59479 RepID=A0A671FGW6_RHIFE